jgi:hypothetical protein
VIDIDFSLYRLRYKEKIRTITAGGYDYDTVKLRGKEYKLRITLCRSAGYISAKIQLTLSTLSSLLKVVEVPKVPKGPTLLREGTPHCQKCRVTCGSAESAVSEPDGDFKSVLSECHFLISN